MLFTHTSSPSRWAASSSSLVVLWLSRHFLQENFILYNRRSAKVPKAEACYFLASSSASLRCWLSRSRVNQYCRRITHDGDSLRQSSILPSWPSCNDFWSISITKKDEIMITVSLGTPLESIFSSKCVEGKLLIPFSLKKVDEYSLHTPCQHKGVPRYFSCFTLFTPLLIINITFRCYFQRNWSSFFWSYF